MSELKAGALSLTLAVAILVTTILTAMILTAYYYRLEEISYQKKIQLNNTLNSAIQVALADESLGYNETTNFQLFEDSQDSVRLQRFTWGLWDLYEVDAYSGANSLSKVFTKGKLRSKEGNSALYLTDERRPISVAGQTKLIGDCYLPAAGIQSAYVNRVGYVNDSLLYGKRLDSDEHMPELNEDLLKRVERLLGLDKALFTSVATYQDVFPVSQSFYNDSTLLFTGDIQTIGDSLRGKVWIHADERIIVESTASLTNVILTAPIIEIDTGFVGTIQAFATDTVLLRKDVYLKYPSAVVVLNEDPPAHIYMGFGAVLNGIALLEGDNNDFNQRVMVIEDDAVINGMVYCHGMLETSGTINGHTTTRKFLVNTLTAIYENYIFNAELNSRNLNPHFLSPELWFYDEKYQVLEWLN